MKRIPAWLNDLPDNLEHLWVWEIRPFFYNPIETIKHWCSRDIELIEEHDMAALTPEEQRAYLS